MRHSVISGLLAWVALIVACTIPGDTLSNTIATPFGILIQNPAFPVIHDRYMNLDPAGGGDQHLFLDPVGDRHFDLALTQGVLGTGIIHAVIDGEYSAVDNTTKMFMTNRGDPKAIFTAVYGCDADTDAVVTQLSFQTREQSPVGGLICVRVASGNRGYEFRYSPPDNPAFDPTNPCMPVTMVVVAGPTAISTATSGPSTSTSSPSTVTGGTTLITSTSTSVGSTPTGPIQPATINVANGAWNWYGCQTEATNMRALSSTTFAADTMTLEACATFCSGFTYFGTEYARECYCGNSFNPGSGPAAPTDCNFLCMGNNLEFCGAGLRLSVYSKNTILPSSSSSSSSAAASPSSSTISSAPLPTSTSTLSSSSAPPPSSASSTSSSNVPSSSTSTSFSSSTFSAVFTSSSTSSTPTASSSPLPYTDMTSKGFAFVGCAPEERRATDGPGRTLTGPLYADDAMTDGKCMDFCSSKGYSFAGTEYTRECWCGNSVAPGRQPQTTVASLAGCNFPCGGDATQFCGGDAWLSLYKQCTVGGACVNAVFT